MHTDWRLIGLLFLAGLFAAAQFAKIALTLVPLAAIYPDAPLPWAVSALSVAGILFGVTAGMIVAQFGARRVILTALVVASLVSLGQAALPGFSVFMWLRVFEGLSHLAIVVAAPTLMAAVAQPKDVPVAMGLWGTFFGVGFAGTAAVLPLLSGPAAVYIAHGLFGLVLVAALWPLLPRGVARGTWQGGIVARHIAIYTSPRIVAPALGFLWHTLMFLGLLTFAPRFLGAWSAPVLPLLALVGTLGAGWLARRYAPADILLTGFGLTIIGGLLVLALSGGAQTVVMLTLFVVMGLVPGASFANVPALNADGADQARSNGAVAQIGNVGTACSVPVMAATLSVGLLGLLLATMVISALGMVSVWFIHRKIAKSA
ncbi:MAG: MFS transporter [Pseudomonadota bacterium]